MKKNFILVVFALLVSVGFMSCGSNKTKNVKLKNGIDSVSYAIGIQNADQMMAYFPEQGRLDLDHMDEFVEGFLEAVYAKEDLSKNRVFGKQVGEEMRNTLATAPLMPNDTTVKVNKDAFVDGMVAILLKKENAKMTKEQATEFAKAFFDKLEKDASVPAIEAEAKFLSENKTKEGIVETASGLQYKIITQGKGEIPGENMKVRVRYTGTLLDGTKFDSSDDHENAEPFEFNTSGGVIPAWIEASKLMPVGSKWIIYVPFSLGYGSRDMGKIPPYSTLIFEIEVLEIVK